MMYDSDMETWPKIVSSVTEGDICYNNKQKKKLANDHDALQVSWHTIVGKTNSGQHTAHINNRNFQVILNALIGYQQLRLWINLFATNFF